MLLVCATMAYHACILGRLDTFYFFAGRCIPARQALWLPSSGNAYSRNLEIKNSAFDNFTDNLFCHVSRDLIDIGMQLLAKINNKYKMK